MLTRMPDLNMPEIKYVQKDCEILYFIYRMAQEMVSVPVRMTVGTKSPSQTRITPHEDFTVGATDPKVKIAIETDESLAIKKAAAALGCNWAQ